MKKFYYLTLCVGALLTGVACAQIGLGEDTSSPVNAAFQVAVSSIGANTATVDFVTEQDNIATYRMVGPVDGLELNYLAMDAIQRKAYIAEHGKDMAAGEPFQLSGMKSKTTYVVGAYGIDKDGTVVTAPTFASFQTKGLEIALQVEKVSEEPGNYAARADVTIDENTASYAYIFDQEHASLTDAELIALLKAKGAGVKTETKSATLTFNSTQPGAVICAVLPFDQIGEAAALVKGKVNFAAAVDENATRLQGDDVTVELQEVSTGIFEGEAAVPASTSFTVVYKKQAYGFISYSGNGGVGRVENPKAAVPFYNLPADTPSPYYVEKAVGRMALVEAEANPFWVNLEAPGEILFRADFTREIPRYYIEYKAAADPKVVLKQNFDLFVWGADYSIPIYGSGVGGGTIGSDDIINYDGTEAAVPNTVKTTAAGIDPFGYYGEGTEHPCSEEFIRNRDMVGWTLGFVAEGPGYIRLSKGTLGWQGWLITPKLSTLAPGTKLTLSFDCARFGPYAVDMPVSILGSGSFTGGKVNAKGDGFVDVSASGTLYNITPTDCPPYDNAYANKPWSRIVLTVEGAGPDTQIMWDARPVTSSKSDIRLRLDNILITQ